MSEHDIADRQRYDDFYLPRYGSARNEASARAKYSARSRA